MDETGHTLANARLPEGVAGIARLHAMIAELLGDEAGVRIETDRGPWVCALVAAGYAVYAVNPLQAARYRERHSVSGAKSDPADAHTLADMARTDSHQLRQVAVDSPEAGAIKVVARTHKTLIWERTRHTQRLWHALREYFPAALEAFDDLDALDTLELLGKAPDPASAAKLNRSQIRGRTQTPPTPQHRHQDHPHPGRAAQPTARSRRGDHRRVRSHHPLDRRGARCPQRADQDPARAGRGAFGRHPDAEIILSQPGMGPIIGARVLAEFGDAPGRYADAKARKNYAATSPITRASGKKKVVLARFVHNDRLIDALIAQWISPQSVEACTMRSSRVRNTQEVRPGVPGGGGADCPGYR